LQTKLCVTYNRNEIKQGEDLVHDIMRILNVLCIVFSTVDLGVAIYPKVNRIILSSTGVDVGLPNHNKFHKSVSVQQSEGNEDIGNEPSSFEKKDEDDSKKISEGNGILHNIDGEIIGVKSKKSNAVGDPDDDSDDDDDIDDLTEWDETEEQINQPLQVEVEVLEQDMNSKESQSSTRGGLGIRLGRRRRNKKTKVETSTPSIFVNSWTPHVYLPPSSSSLSSLHENARQIEAAAKVRLDRGTLYSGLLLELTSATTSRRKYFSKETTQQLQAALCLATQPQWRSAFPQASGIMLYDPDDDKPGATLSMQETVAMALVSKTIKNS
jgi:hypothetical protein